MLAGKRILITGVLTAESIAWSAASLAQQLGAEVILTSFGRVRRITERASRMLPSEAEVLELDVSEPDHFPALADELQSRWGTVDGVLHSIAFAPSETLGEDWLSADWPQVSEALRVSAFSLSELARALAPLMERTEGTSSIVTLVIEPDYGRPHYGWMGPAKAMLVSVMSYLVTTLGERRIRSNAVSSGPLTTAAASALPYHERTTEIFDAMSALGWDPTDKGAIAGPICFLLSDYASAITGSVLRVDSGFPQFGPILESSFGRPPAAG